MPVLNTDALTKNRVEAIRAYHDQSGIERAELDVSGGIDSALMLMLLSEALGPDNVTAVYSSINSSEASRELAHTVGAVAGVSLIDLDLTEHYAKIVDEVMVQCVAAGYAKEEELLARRASDPAIEGSFRSCLRAPVGRFCNRLTGGGIRHGTGNEDEDRWLRFFQKGGDGEVDTNPLAMLSKGEVYQLAVAIGVPSPIVEATPTPDLWASGLGHTDEEELTRLSGVEWTYSRVDPKHGSYDRVGTIERMSRLLDRDGAKTHFSGYESVEDFFLGDVPVEMGHEPPSKTAMVIRSYLDEFGLTEAHFNSARRWERATRHKANPNCPTLGTRRELLDAGILTNELPTL